jgi:SAM-dependent methyltransferase
MVPLKLWFEKHTPSTKNYLRSELLRLKSKNLGSKSPIEILDVGSSSGEIWKQVASDGWLKSKGIYLEVTLFDANAQAYDKATQAEGLTLVFFSGIAPVDLRKFGSETFDLVTAFDIIEHLPKDQGYHLLYELNRLSATSVIRCPNGFVWQPPFESNPFQAHVSSWTARELKGLGWNKQYGESGLKWLVGIGTIPHWITSQSSLRRRFSFLERVPLALSQLLLFKAPGLMAEVVSIRRTRAFDLENHISTKIN